MDRRLQFLLLVVINMIHVPSTTRSFTVNYIASYADPDKILRDYKDALPPELLVQLERVLHYHNPRKFIGYITVKQRRQACACGNYSSVSNSIAKVETILNNKECINT